MPAACRLGVAVPGAAEVGGGAEAPGAGDGGGGDVFDVSLTGVELVDLGGVDVEAEDGVAVLGVAQHQGQTDVAEAEDADLGLFWWRAAGGGEAGVGRERSSIITHSFKNKQT
jgi:hypothetical protein